MEKSNIIVQDMDVTLKALEEQDFLHINILGNRILSNILFLEDKSPFLVGFFLKEISITLQKINAVSENETILLKAKETFDSLRDLIKNNETDYEKYWNAYYELLKLCRYHLIKKSEKEVYKENHEFSKAVCDGLIDLMNDNKVLVLKENNQFIRGLAHELDRVLNEFGGSINSYILLTIFKVLAYYYTYILTESISLNMDFNKDILKKKFFPLVDELISIYKTNNDFMLKASEMLLKIGIEWRKYYLFYMEQQKQVISEERKIDLPLESRKKIGSIIMKALENELK